LIERVSQVLQFCGPITLQAFCSEHEGPWLIEINPRFGGARALSEEAGLATSERLVSLVMGDSQDFYQTRLINKGLMHLRFSDDLFISPANLYQPD
jgi:carbamoylphosphate synthase large subunit